MGKQYAGQVEAQRKMLIQNWAVLLLFLRLSAGAEPARLGREAFQWHLAKGQLSPELWNSSSWKEPHPWSDPCQ